MFGFDGRTLKSWRLSGVPVGKRQAVERLVETLNILVTKQVLPIDILDLALIGLSKLERDHG
jgi:hypothetical protein